MASDRSLHGPGGGKKADERRLLPLPGGKIGQEGPRLLPRVKVERRMAFVSCGGIPCLFSGTRMVGTWRKSAAAGKQRASLHATGTINADETGRSRPIGAACRPAWRTSRLVASQGYSTAQSHATSVSHTVRPLWYPLDLKRRT
jgi:hypothetical protein